jgi:hypothetical protein
MADVDVISDILKAAFEAFPESNFIQSLSHQYLIRGWLSKKQMQGLYDKALKIDGLAPGKLATLEAQILKMPNKYRSEKPATEALYTRDERTGELIAAVLQKYPGHKRVLYFEANYKNNRPLSPAEATELEKFYKFLIEGKK